MSRIYEYQETPYYGGSSIDEYLDRITRMHRAPTMSEDHFPAAHTPHHHHHNNNDHRINIFRENHHAPPDPVVHKKVHFTEHEKHVEVDSRGKHEVYAEKTIDMEADGFIQKRHKNFESCNTFKGY